MSSENIFSALAKYNSAIDENYLTESFVFVINSLLQRERPIGLEILTKLCVENDEFSFDKNEAISISTQETTKQGRPDIKVFSPDKLIYIEVKYESGLGYQQLERYMKALESSNAATKHVILLTRYSVDFEEEGRPYKHVRWSKVYNWLASAKDKAKDSVSCYLIEQFMYFLEVKQMSVPKVGWEYINGVHALNNLMDMIKVAIEDASLQINPRAQSRDYRGYYFDNVEFWCGIAYAEPLFVKFEIEYREKFDTQLVKKPSYPLKDKDMLQFLLRLEDIHFFSLDKDKQLEEITRFVKTAHAEAQQMRIK